MQRLLTRFWKGPHRNEVLWLAGGVLLAAVTLVAWGFLRNTPLASVQVMPSGPSAALADGLRRARAGEVGLALQGLCRAVDGARTPQERADAGLAIGELLTERARLDPANQALPAKQYLRGVLALETRPAPRVRALRALLTVAVLQKDLPCIRSVCADLAKMKLPEEDAPRLLLQQLDAMLESGDLRALYALLDGCGPYQSHPDYGAEIALRQALVGEQILEHRELFDAWRADAAGARGGAEGEAERRAGLVRATLVQLGAAAESRDEATAKAARFHMAKVLCLGGLYAEAGYRLDMLLRGSSPAFQREALLLRMPLTSRDDRRDAFGKQVTRYLATFGWDPAVEAEVLRMVGKMQAQENTAEALAFMKQQLEVEAPVAAGPKFLIRMGALARGEKKYAQADDCYARLLALPGAGEYRAAALLARGELCVAQGDRNGAREKLFQYLNAYPHDRQNAAAAFTLLGSLLQGNGRAGLDMGAVAILMAQRMSDDVHAADLLIAAGTVFETHALPELAQPYYRKGALLRSVQQSVAAEPGTGTDELARIRLAQVRCLLALGQQAEADHLLRRLCAVQTPGPLRSEAACLWAEMALDRAQWREGARRLALADPTVADAAVAWRITVNRLSMETAAGPGTNRSLDALLVAMKDPVAAGYAPLVARVYQRCLARLAAAGDAPALKRMLEAARLDAVELPLEQFRRQAACTFLGRGDFIAAAEWVKDDSNGLTALIDGVRIGRETMRRHL